jgi:predicted small secreted protein
MRCPTDHQAGGESLADSLDMKKNHLAVVALTLCSAFALSSCETATGTGALIGAGTGAVIGSNTGPYYRDNTGRTVAGAAIGAGVGALIGAAIDADERGYYEGRPADDYPMGRRVGRGLVRSPYTGQIVDVRGIPRGALVRDPSTGQPFRKP